MAIDDCPARDLAPPHNQSEPSGPAPAGPDIGGRPATLQAVLTRLDLSRDAATVFGVWPRTDGSLELHLSAGAFWRTVARHGLAVTSTEAPNQLSPHRHAVEVDGIELFTRTAEPVLPPGVLTPGYALRLT
jgi:hypothetical protein